MRIVFRGVSWFVCEFVKGEEGKRRITKEGLEHQKLPLSAFQSSVMM